MADVPNITPGSKFTDFTSRQWQAAMRAAERAQKMQTGRGVGSAGGERSLSLSVIPDVPTPAPRDRWVVVVEEPGASATYVKVRPIRYKGPVPAFGVYEWDGLPFVAYPPPGLAVSDFANLAHTEAAPPTADVAVLKASFERFFWMLQSMGGGGGGPKLCKIMATSGADNVTVQFVTPKEDEGAPRGYTLENDGDPVMIKTWPAWRRDSYEPFIGRQDVMPVFTIGGFAFIDWRIRIRPMAPPSGADVITGDCP